MSTIYSPPTVLQRLDTDGASVRRSWLRLRSLLATAAAPLTPTGTIFVASFSGRPMSVWSYWPRRDPTSFSYLGCSRDGSRCHTRVEVDRSNPSTRPPRARGSKAPRGKLGAEASSYQRGSGLQGNLSQTSQRIHRPERSARTHRYSLLSLQNQRNWSTRCPIGSQIRLRESLL